MEINDRLKRIIFKKLVKDLSHVEIIPYRRSIWFIDRNKKYWYFQLEDDGTLWWRYDFFDIFFQAFSLEIHDYKPLIKEWVEQVLNHNVNTTFPDYHGIPDKVEKVLNHKVNVTMHTTVSSKRMVERVLNHKITTSLPVSLTMEESMEHVLNSK
jgi:hypothetical protein